jgi:hypothetical protein
VIGNSRDPDPPASTIPFRIWSVVIVIPQSVLPSLM